MNKMLEPSSEPTMTGDEEAYMVARALEGLSDIVAGRTMSIEEAKAEMVSHMANLKRNS